MNKWREKTAIKAAEEKKRFLARREKRLLWLLILSMIAALVIGLLNGRYEMGGWEIVISAVLIANYVVYYLWSDSQVRKYEVEHLALGYYANDQQDIPPEQLRKYDKLKFEYIRDVLKNTVVITLLCGGLVLAGQKLAEGSLAWLWLVLIILLPVGAARLLHYQKHQISRFGKNGTNLMSK